MRLVLLLPYITIYTIKKAHIHKDEIYILN